MFEIERKGYNKKNVEAFISNLNKSSTALVNGLRAEIEDLKQENYEFKKELQVFKSKEEQINKAIISANEKADQITKNSEDIFNLQIENLQALYEQYFDTMQTIKEKYNLFDEEELSAENFKKSIKILLDKSISEDIKKEKFVFKTENKPNIAPREEEKYDKYYHKQLLNKLSDGLTNFKEPMIHKEEYTARFEPKIDYAFLEKIKDREKEDDFQKSKEKKNVQNEREMNAINIEEMPSQIKPILNMSATKLDSGTHYTSLLEKYLNEDEASPEFVTATYAKKIVEKNNRPNLFNIPNSYKGANSTGFDLREAVNPKDSLEDIMKDLDFFGNKDNE